MEINQDIGFKFCYVKDIPSQEDYAEQLVMEILEDGTTN